MDNTLHILDATKRTRGEFVTNEANLMKNAPIIEERYGYSA